MPINVEMTVIKIKKAMPSHKEQNPVNRELINEITNGINNRIKVCLKKEIDVGLSLSNFLR